MSPTSPLSWLAEVERDRVAAGLRRRLRVRGPAEPEIDLASNDYLGLARHPQVIEAGVDAMRLWGAGSTGSRLVTGNTALHEDFEVELAAFVGAESALVFSSGYTANLGAVVALSGPESLIVSDARTHASLIDACRLSRARVVVTPHRDLTAVSRALAQRREKRALVLTDSIFSADGALAPLPELHAICRDYGAVLLVDEAHALGVRGSGGRGMVAEAGLAGQDDVVVTATLSKALGSQGGVVLGAQSVRDHLVDTARTFIFDTGVAPAAVGAALAALRIMMSEPQRAQGVLDRAAELAELCGLSSRPESAVVPVPLGDAELAFRSAEACLELGVRVGCFRPPSVPVGESLLRLTARGSLTDRDMDRVREVLAQVLAGADEGLARRGLSTAR